MTESVHPLTHETTQQRQRGNCSLSRRWRSGTHDANRRELTCSCWETALVRRAATFANRKSPSFLSFLFCFFFYPPSFTPLSSRAERPQNSPSLSSFFSLDVGFAGWKVGEVVALSASFFACSLPSSLTRICFALWFYFTFLSLWLRECPAAPRQDCHVHYPESPAVVVTPKVVHLNRRVRARLFVSSRFFFFLHWAYGKLNRHSHVVWHKWEFILTKFVLTGVDCISL